MDLIRVFLETAFCKLAPHINCLDGALASLSQEKRLLVVDRTTFLECARKEHEEYSDDNLKLLYGLYESEWSLDAQTGKHNIMNSLAAFASKVLVISGSEPRVNFNHLFRWRELAYVVGEDLLVCAYLARQECYNAKPRKSYRWGNVLKTDNAELNYLFEKEKLSELHQHLKASTDVFGISWVCLMNKVKHRRREFVSLYKNKDEADAAYMTYIEAASIRLYLYRKICERKDHVDVAEIKRYCIDAQWGDVTGLAAEINLAYKYKRNRNILDYACQKWNDERSVFEGERQLLYEVLKYIYMSNDVQTTELLYKYVLAKARIRARMVQVSKQVGFANFSRFECVKEVFLEQHCRYAELLKSLPVQEAMHDHYVGFLETRIAPKSPYSELLAAHVDTEKRISTGLTEEQRKNRHITYHFIKREDKRCAASMVPRNHRVRIEVRNQAIALRKLQQAQHEFVGIDAANSEMFCRPEVFAQAYRYLDDGKIKRTYHAGEDYFDLTDGLRTIDEAINFLALRNGDRIGHGIALGINPTIYYEARHWHIPVPKQVLLDNLTWLYHQAKRLNLLLPPIIEHIIEELFRKLIVCYEDNRELPTMSDYWLAMKLRGCDPYTDENARIAYYARDWKSCALDMNEEVRQLFVRDKIRHIYHQYHFSEKVRLEGETVIDFKVPHEFPEVLFQLQESMMTEIAKKQIAIECCPTSNVKIAKLGEYALHPIMRFHPIEDNGLIRPAVSINTDDLGVFVTSADNEYSLMALSLMKQKDKEGRLKYNATQVRNWLETIILQSKAYQFA